MKDQLNRIVDLEKKPQRIISLVPSLTELLVDLGLEDNIVGVTRFCVHPIHLRKKATVVGGTKQVRNKKIQKLQPDLIFANKEENQPEDIEALEKICPIHVSDVQTIEDCYKLIEQYGNLTKTVKQAGKLNSELKNAHTDFSIFIKDKPQLKVAYLIWKDPWMAVGGDSFINEMLKINHYDNVFKHQSVIRRSSLQICKKPILFSYQQNLIRLKRKMQKELPIDSAKVRIVDGEYFSWYGSRLIQAFNYFKKLRDQLD